MSSALAVLFVILLHGSITLASDPESLQDFCIASTGAAPCKNSSLATVEDFIFSGLNGTGQFSPLGLAAIPVNANALPGLNTLGISLLRLDFKVGGISVPHHHPRATEVSVVLQGSVYSGFVDTQNRVFAKVVEQGEVIVFPKGLVHFQLNVGDKPAAVLASFNSQNPGFQGTSSALFGCAIQAEVLERTLGLNATDIAKLRKNLGC